MASSTAPYDASMRLGMGFNSFTQELCLADAIVKTASSQKKDQRNASPSVEHGGSNVKVSKQKVLEANAALDQQVHSTVKFVSRYSELVDALGVSAASQIQHARGHYAAFLNVDNFNDHHVDYLIRVVASRPVPCSELTELDIIPNLPKEEFSKIYGDSFISGFNEGGEFVALISVKLADPSHANIAAVKRQLEETMDLTFRVGSETVAPDSRPLVLEGEFKTVVQRRGGQISEAPSKWTLRDIREEAMAFAKHAFAYPVRLSPILTKYTTLRSFHVAKMQHAFVVPEYDRHGANVHAEALLDAYVEYRAVAREIQHAEWEVAHGLSSLTVQTATDDLAQLSAQAQANYEAWLGRKEESAAPPSTPPKWFNTLSPYHASIIGLSKARQDCQDEIIRILDEVNAFSSDVSRER
ncbi:hypothetical protein C8F01DRAFT_743716 [Mycena amicta]|nr:hypothetical protein C8F01DRAFT_743716 [Mycena amicta]